MKKLLVLLVFLELINSANAAVTDALIFTVNGQPQPSEITLQPSQTIEIGLELDVGHNITTYILDYKILQGSAELICTSVTFPMVFAIPSKVIVNSPPSLVRIGGTQFVLLPIPGPGVIMQGLQLHCLNPDMNLENPTILQITSTHDTWIDDQQLGPDGTVVYTLIIHQIPEPATVLLLGLGGLLLRKRK